MLNLIREEYDSDEDDDDESTDGRSRSARRSVATSCGFSNARNSTSKIKELLSSFVYISLF
jgi:hypothetical protein